MNGIKEIQFLLTDDRSLLFAVDEKGQTLIHLAVRRGCYEATLLLLVMQGPKNMPDKAGYRPIDFAVTTQQTDMVKLLLAAGCDPWRIKLKEFSNLSWESLNQDIKGLIRIAQMVTFRLTSELCVLHLHEPQQKVGVLEETTASQCRVWSRYTSMLPPTEGTRLQHERSRLLQLVEWSPQLALIQKVSTEVGQL